MIRLFFVIIISVLLPSQIHAQVATISGYVRDSILKKLSQKQKLPQPPIIQLENRVLQIHPYPTTIALKFHPHKKQLPTPTVFTV